MTKEENFEKMSITIESHLYLHPGESPAVARVTCIRSWKLPFVEQVYVDSPECKEQTTVREWGHC